MPAAVLAALAVLLAGCGLPVERGVQIPETGTADDRGIGAEQGGPGLAELPPGPQPGEPPVNVVNGFLQAQSSAEADHAVARRFLAPAARESWDDDAQVQVYDPLSLSFDLDGDPSASDVVRVRVRGTVISTVSANGSLAPTDVPLDDTYTLGRDADGNWQLTEVPPGLRLDPEDLERSYETRLVYYVVRGSGPEGHLVPDPALLAVEDDIVTGLVRRLVAGPSASLAGAVVTAVPAGAEVVAVSTDAAGRVTVDLGPEVARLRPVDLQRLSAQLVWTLRGAGPAFGELRLLSAGRPVDVPGVEGEVQERTTWEGYDPDGLRRQTTTYYVADRRVRTLEGGGSPVDAAADLPADRAAVSPRTDRLALLTDVGEGRWEVRVGPLTGPLPAQPTYTGDDLRSPSWGSGERGLWLLQTGPEPAVLLLDPAGQARSVPFTDRPPGRLSAMRVSRDGARIALVAGEDDASRRVYVAPVEAAGEGVRIGPLREIGFGVTDVSDVAWESATEVVVIGRVQQPGAPRPLVLAIDDPRAVGLVRSPGLEQVTPESIAAGPGRPLVVAASREDRPVLLRSSGNVFVEEPVAGTAPFYPG